MCGNMKAGDLIESKTLVGNTATLGGNGSEPLELELTGVVNNGDTMMFIGKTKHGDVESIVLSADAARTETMVGYVIDMGGGRTLTIPQPIRG